MRRNPRHETYCSQIMYFLTSLCIFYCFNFRDSTIRYPISFRFLNRHLFEYGAVRLQRTLRLPMTEGTLDDHRLYDPDTRTFDPSGIERTAARQSSAPNQIGICIGPKVFVGLIRSRPYPMLLGKQIAAYIHQTRLEA